MNRHKGTRNAKQQNRSASNAEESPAGVGSEPSSQGQQEPGYCSSTRAAAFAKTLPRLPPGQPPPPGLYPSSLTPTTLRSRGKEQRVTRYLARSCRAGPATRNLHLGRGCCAPTPPQVTAQGRGTSREGTKRSGPEKTRS